MFVVNKVVEEDYLILLANELESITLSDGTTQALQSRRATRFLSSRTFVCLVRESVRKSYSSNTSTRPLLLS